MGYGDRFVDAFRFAAERHAAQLRKGSEVPYITHLMAVAATVGECGGDEDAVIAALLHDVIEDQGVSADEIASRFGEEVARTVVACSDSTGHPKPPWRDRKERYIDHLRSAPPHVRLVSAADKLHNARSIVRDVGASGPGVWKRFNASPADIVWYYRAVVDALGCGWSHPVLAELARAVDDVAALAAQT